VGIVITTPEACRIAQVTLRQADHWLHLGALPLRPGGTGTRIAWSIEDVAQIAVIGACVAAGAEPRRAFSIGWQARRALDEGRETSCILIAPSTPPLYLAPCELLDALGRHPGPDVWVVWPAVVLDRVLDRWP
jgi:hypothetical protein